MRERAKRKAKKLTGAMVTGFLVLAVLLCVFVVSQVLSRGYVCFGPYSLFRVVTGSMEPALPVGTLLVSQNVEMEQVEQGDIVCFRATVMGRVGEVVTHRVISIGKAADGGVLLETKGDANLAADAEYVTQRNYVGKVVWYSAEDNPLPNVLSFLTSGTGFLLCIAVPCLLVVTTILRSCVSSIRKELKQAIEELAAEEQAQQPAQEDYDQMEARIRRELMAELTAGMDKEPEQVPAAEEETNVESAEELRQGAED